MMNAPHIFGLVIAAFGLAFILDQQQRPPEQYGRRATSSPEAERTRLTGELTMLAQKNAWDGVERTYAQLLELDIPLPTETHLLGAMAAAQHGDALTTKQRAQKGIASSRGQVFVRGGPLDMAQQLVQHIERTFGLVDIRTRPGEPLVALERPFETAAGRAIDLAATRVSSEGAFRGLLPVGRYHLGGRAFEVRPGTSETRIS